MTIFKKMFLGSGRIPKMPPVPPPPHMTQLDRIEASLARIERRLRVIEELCNQTQVGVLE